MNPVDQIGALFAGPGTEDYLGESVTQAEHMRQAGALAKAFGASDELIGAALLHDIGHFHGAITGKDLMSGTDNQHSHSGSDWLGQWFAPAVTEPIRLHVAAKRYLCSVEPDYFAALSAASVYTLEIQGGPMTPQQAREFEAEPYHADAVALRRWDDQAKDPHMPTPHFDEFRELLHRLLTTR